MSLKKKVDKRKSGMNFLPYHQDGEGFAVSKRKLLAINGGTTRQQRRVVSILPEEICRT
jgi:hypothetical protein